MRAPDGLHPVEGLPRVIRVEIVKFMGPQLRTGRSIQAVPPGTEGEVAKPAKLARIPSRSRQNARHGKPALFGFQRLLEIQIAAALGNGGKALMNPVANGTAHGPVFCQSRSVELRVAAVQEQTCSAFRQLFIPERRERNQFRPQVLEQL